MIRRITRKLSLEEALYKAQRYCAYQERCVTEVSDRLTLWGVDRKHQESIIRQLVDDNFINEERFAEIFAKGKFTIKRWGKLKIKAALRQKNISDNLIRKALTIIETGAYLESVNYLMSKKLTELGGVPDYENRTKLVNYLASKGYEMELIMDSLAGLQNKIKK